MCLLQIAGVINNAVTKLRDAGAVLVPFDSTAFDELSVSAWPGATLATLPGFDPASSYESIEVFARWVVLLLLLFPSSSLCLLFYFTLLVCLPSVTDVTDQASFPEPGLQCCCRWLALHNSSISVTDVINQINRPAEKAVYKAAQAALSTSLYGSTQNFIDYIQKGTCWSWLSTQKPHWAHSEM